MSDHPDTVTYYSLTGDPHRLALPDLEAQHQPERGWTTRMVERLIKGHKSLRVTVNLLWRMGNETEERVAAVERENERLHGRILHLEEYLAEREQDRRALEVCAEINRHDERYHGMGN